MEYKIWNRTELLLISSTADLFNFANHRFCANSVKMENLNPLQVFKLVHRYYWTVMSCPIKFRSSPKFTRIPSGSYFQLFYYYFIRTIGTIIFFQYTRLIFKNLWKFYSAAEFDNVELSGIVIYLLSMLPILTGDFFLWNTNFNFSFKRLVNLWENIWRQANFRESFVKRLTTKLCFQTALICIHNILFDYYFTYGYAKAMFYDLSQDSTQLYNDIPWKIPVINATFWVTISLFFFLTNCAWSLMLVFPCVIAYNIEACVKLLTFKLKATSRFDEFTRILEKYQYLVHCTRDGITSLIAKQLLAFYIIVGYAQFLEAYFIFQLIKGGAVWDEFQFLLMDVLVNFKQNLTNMT